VAFPRLYGLNYFPSSPSKINDVNRLSSLIRYPFDNISRLPYETCSHAASNLGIGGFRWKAYPLQPRYLLKRLSFCRVSPRKFPHGQKTIVHGHLIFCPWLLEIRCKRQRPGPPSYPLRIRGKDGQRAYLSSRLL